MNTPRYGRVQHQMKMTEIIDLANVASMRERPDHEQYLLHVVLKLIQSGSSDFVLRKERDAWVAFYRVDGRAHQFDYLLRDAGKLDWFLRNGIAKQIFPEEFGSFARVCFFLLHDEVAVALFAYDTHPNQQGQIDINMRLVYGANATDVAARLVAAHARSFEELKASGKLVWSQ